MKHIRKFENYTLKNKRETLIKEAVIQVNDIYKVKTMVDVPQSLINSYIKKVKDTTGVNARQLWSDVDIAEEIVKYIASTYTNVDQIPASVIAGGEEEVVAPVEEAPVEEAPVEEAPVEEAPVEEAPVEEAPVEEAPVEEAPVEEAPVEELPTEELPTEEFEELGGEVAGEEETTEGETEEGEEELPI